MFNLALRVTPAQAETPFVEVQTEASVSQGAILRLPLLATTTVYTYATDKPWATVVGDELVLDATGVDKGVYIVELTAQGSGGEAQRLIRVTVI